jgi:recombination associated protein RdgC
MGAKKGSLTFSRLHVRGDLPEDFRDTFIDAIAHHAFRPLEVHDEESERAGWCVLGEPLSTELSHEKVYCDAFLNLGLRVDRWRIPSAIYKAHYQTAEQKLLAELGRERLSRAQKEDLKTMVVRRLRELVMPTMSVVDFSWNLERREVRFFHRSPRMIELLGELFEETFKLELVLESAYLAATRLGLDEPTLDALTAVEPTPFRVEMA